ncbi:MAG: sulfite exporter TauE/SafE family protein [Sulfobacillus thermotolerans]|nr:sulfite exporter TauE/SafE family protein [Sulfobacillus thermotolerans]
MIALVAVLIFLVSTVFAMLGMGGGMLHVPILLWFGYPLKTVAQPVGILLNGITTLVALVVYARNRLVDWKGSWGMAVAALLAAPLGSIVARMVADRLLIILLVLMIFFAAIRTLLTAHKAEPEKFAPSRMRQVLGTIVVAFAAFLGAMLGLGGGTLISPMLMWMGYPTKKAVATSAFVVTVSSASGFAGRVGHMAASWELIVVLSLAVMLAAWLGSWVMATRAKPKWVKYGYSLLLVGVGIKLLIPIL